MKFDDFTLAMPVVAKDFLEASPVLVLQDSPLSMRRRVEKIGRYFHREFRTDFPPLLANEKSGPFGCMPFEAYLFVEAARDRLEENRPFPNRFVGAACFRWQSWTNAEPSWELSWIWLHPFSRRRGHLSQAWPQFREKYGSFVVSEVLSRDMEAFLAKYRADR